MARVTIAALPPFEAKETIKAGIANTVINMPPRNTKNTSIESPTDALIAFQADIVPHPNEPISTQVKKIDTITTMPQIAVIIDPAILISLLLSISYFIV
jgi:hypothetical protein